MTLPKPGRIYPDRETAKEIRDAAKREAYEDAAKIVDGFNENPDWPDWPMTQCAAAIRARIT
jgi:hypothetical protein